MNAAARAAVRLGLHRGHTMLGVYGSLRGLIDGDVRELHWGDVEGWAGAAAVPNSGSAGTSLRSRISTRSAADWRQHDIDALLIIGGWDAFQAAAHDERRSGIDTPRSRSR